MTVRRCDQNVPEKIGEVRPVLLTTPVVKCQEVDQGPGGVITSSMLLSPLLVRS